ncbi:MAG: signal peptidase I [Lawsonibacter sp.]|jgi:signal peptidase I|nr:signal peptidase I [Lawsonibacter sp.]
MDEYNGLPQQPEELSAVPEEEDEEEQAPRRPGAELYEWLQMFLGCVVAAVVLFNCVARLTRVDGSSMDTTLQHGEIMLIWSLGYTPKQGDIVVLNKTSVLLPDWTEPRAIVKRVIATGGQTVDVDYSTGTVYVDGRPLDEPYLHEEMRRPGAPSMQETHWEVPEGSIFVMGDNRNYSTDSRDSLLGAIDTDYILGKAILALWPLNRFGAV